jgi:hypothetical protein
MRGHAHPPGGADHHRYGLVQVLQGEDLEVTRCSREPPAGRHAVNPQIGDRVIARLAIGKLSVGRTALRAERSATGAFGRSASPRARRCEVGTPSSVIIVRRE